MELEGTSIRYYLPSGERGTLTVYDPSGRSIESYRVQGEGKVAMRANLPSGVYFIKLEAGKASVTKKVVVLR
ncbi:T9SS type A sorting domain-containing protein [bacterium]|nr:T9SS type A sorting domain-containing protein [bacterium]